MTLQSLFWLLGLLLAPWALAVVVTVVKWSFDALAADARNARLAPGSLRSAGRDCIHYGVIFTSFAVSTMIFMTIDGMWHFSLKPFSHDLAAYSGLVKKVILGTGSSMCFVLIVALLSGLLDRLLPDAPANRTPAA
jgi:hypothetical protein